MSDLVTIVGTITGKDPELHFTPGGKAVVNFSVRVPGQKANPQHGREASEAYFQYVTAWEKLGENVAESLQQGDRVIVRGLLSDDSYTKPDGEVVSKTKLTAWSIGPELSFVGCTVNRVQETHSGQPQAEAYAAF